MDDQTTLPGLPTQWPASGYKSPDQEDSASLRWPSIFKYIAGLAVIAMLAIHFL